LPCGIEAGAGGEQSPAAFPSSSPFDHFLHNQLVRIFGRTTLTLGTNFLRLLSETMHSTSSSLQLVQGLCSTTLQRTLRALHDWQAFEARLLTLLWALAPVAGRPASLAFRFELGELEGLAGASRSPLTDESDMMYGRWARDMESARAGGRGGAAYLCI
jgi:hypothetical protein